LLIIQGGEDMLPEEGEKLFNALRRLERPVQYARYEGEGHVVQNWRLPNAMDAAGRIVEFLDRRLRRGVVGDLPASASLK
jgi:dipeptidyl aminopeptidase/acylaminoacyl peptidase